MKKKTIVYLISQVWEGIYLLFRRTA